MIYIIFISYLYYIYFASYLDFFSFKCHILLLPPILHLVIKSSYVFPFPSLICLVMHLCLNTEHLHSYIFVHRFCFILFLILDLQLNIFNSYYQLFCETFEDILTLVEDICSSRFLNLGFWAEYPLRSWMLKIVYI